MPCEVGQRVACTFLGVDGTRLGEIVRLDAPVGGQPTCTVKLDGETLAVSGVVWLESGEGEVRSSLWQCCEDVSG
jgi:hypothetical protein